MGSWNVPEPLSGELLKVLHEIKHVFQDFTLVGGTNLAYRFKHRVSFDIDFFISGPVPDEKLKDLYQYLVSKYGKDECDGLKLENYNKKHLNTFSYIPPDFHTNLRIDVVQNLLFMKETTRIDGINFLSLEDIGLMKIDSRGGNKDAYDLDFLTEKEGGGIDILDLWELYKEKRALKEKLSIHNVFDKYRFKDPLRSPEALKNIKREYYILPCMWVDEDIALERWKLKVDKLLRLMK